MDDLIRHVINKDHHPKRTFDIFFTYVAPEFHRIVLDIVNNVLFILLGCFSCNFSYFIACPPVLRTRLFVSVPI